MTYRYKMPIAQGYKVKGQEKWCYKITVRYFMDLFGKNFL